MINLNKILLILSALLIVGCTNKEPIKLSFKGQKIYKNNNFVIKETPFFIKQNNILYIGILYEDNNKIKGLIKGSMENNITTWQNKEIEFKKTINFNKKNFITLDAIGYVND